MLTTTPEMLRRSSFVRQPLRVRAYKEKRKPIASGWSRNVGRHLRVGRYTYPLLL